jgi:adenine-specific DNA-methyltransferase
LAAIFKFGGPPPPPPHTNPPKKYGLVWEHKSEAIVELCETNLPVLKEVVECAISASEGQPTNILIEGDNYHALSVLNYTHKEKIDVIYIDPPYNTGNKDFKYNDNFVDTEDAFRHSKWLSFMNVRLILAKNLLSEKGVIFISIDDNEQAHLKLLCDELFGEENVEQMIWKKNDFTDGVLKLTKRFRIEHEYIITCYKGKNKIEFNRVLQLSQVKNEYTNPDNDNRGQWISTELGRSENKSRKDSLNYYDIESPTGKKWFRQWLFDKEEMKNLIKDKRIYFGKDGNAIPRLKKFINEERPKAATSILQEYGSARSGMRELEELFQDKVFNYPKPIDLINYLLKLIKKEDLIVLDFFAGSGTTGHSVLELNRENGGNRQFILCTNNENSICEKVTYPRIEKVINGYGQQEGIPANLRYFKAEFVENKGNRSQLKKDFTVKSEDMLRIKENCFDLVKKGKQYKIFCDAKKQTYLGIFFDFFTDKEFEFFVDELKKLDKKTKKKIYIFSLDNFADNSLFTGVKNFSLEPIPEKILNIYKQLSREIRK